MARLLEWVLEAYYCKSLSYRVGVLMELAVIALLSLPALQSGNPVYLLLLAPGLLLTWENLVERRLNVLCGLRRTLVIGILALICCGIACAAYACGRSTDLFFAGIASAFLGALLSVFWFAIHEQIRWVRGSRASENARCGCGYDLTGNVSGVCPECGDPCKSGWVD